MPNDTYDDIRTLLFESTSDLAALAPAPDRTIQRARRRMIRTVSIGTLVAGLVLGGILSIANPFTRSLPAKTPHVKKGAWVVNIDTGSSTRFQGLPRGAFWFDVSADGSTMAFAARSHGRTQVFVSAPDGSGSHVVTHDAYGGSQPALSPDGSMVAYQGFGHDDLRNVFIVNLTTGRVRQLTHERHDVSELTWSPHGSRILYSMSIAGGPSASVFDNGASSVLKVVDVRNGRVEKLVGTHRSSADFGTWSSDGTRIAYMTGHAWTDNAYGFNPAEIWVMDASGSSPRMVRALDSRAFGLAWTPDGELSFTEQDGDVFNTYGLNVHTGQTRVIADGIMPVWLDDHTVIVQR